MDTEVTVGDIDLSQIKSRSLIGVITLISGSLISQLISTVGFILLSIFLKRPEIGLFIAVNDLVAILGYFSDVGLAASLIQKKDSVTLTDLRTTFTIQQTIIVILLLLTAILSPWLFSFYRISPTGKTLFYSLLVAFFLSSLKTIPSVVLERQLRFKILTAIAIIENLVFYVVAVFLSWRGAGIAAYTWAVLLQALIGLFVIYIIAPWQIGLGFSKSSLKTLLSFGLPFQFNSLMAVIKDRFMSVILWRIIGSDGVGTLGFAQRWPQQPLRLVMDNVTRVTFPSFARLQDHRDELKHGIEKTLFFITLITFPCVAGITIIFPDLFHLIPKWEQWQIAAIPLALYSLNSAWAAVSSPLTNTLNALGKVKINTYLMIMWTALGWIFTPWLALRYGYIGVAYATGIISFTSIIPVVIVRRYVRFSLWTSFGQPLAATAIMALPAYILSRYLSPSWLNVGIIIITSITVFFASIYTFVGIQLIKDFQKLWYAVSKKI